MEDMVFSQLTFNFGGKDCLCLVSKLVSTARIQDLLADTGTPLPSHGTNGSDFARGAGDFHVIFLLFFRHCKVSEGVVVRLALELKVERLHMRHVGASLSRLSQVLRVLRDNMKILSSLTLAHLYGNSTHVW